MAYAVIMFPMVIIPMTRRKTHAKKSKRRKIHIKKSKRGSLHKALGVPKNKKIPASKLASKPGDSKALKKKKVFARNARKWKKRGKK